MAQSWNRTVDDGFVDMEQIIKRLEWLDNERRKDKSRITALESRITDLNTNHSLLQGEIKDLQEEVARFSSIQNRIDLLDHQISQLRIDAFRQIEERDKTHTEQRLAGHILPARPLPFANTRCRKKTPVDGIASAYRLPRSDNR